MKAINFPEANTILPGIDIATKEPTTLPHYSREGITVSKWEPTNEERKAIEAGADIYVIMVLPGHPGMNITTNNPFIKEEKKPLNGKILGMDGNPI